jgi:hypothetical protein
MVISTLEKHTMDQAIQFLNIEEARDLEQRTGAKDMVTVKTSNQEPRQSQ